MIATEQQLKRIQEKLQQVLKQYSSLQKENYLLKEELHALKEQQAGQQENMIQLKQQVDILKYSGGEMSDEDKKQFEKKLNGYIREIDRCIAMLSE